MKQKTSSGYEDVFPRTKAELVEGVGLNAVNITENGAPFETLSDYESDTDVSVVFSLENPSRTVNINQEKERVRVNCLFGNETDNDITVVFGLGVEAQLFLPDTNIVIPAGKSVELSYVRRGVKIAGYFTGELENVAEVVPGFKTDWNIPNDNYSFDYPITGLSPVDGDCRIYWGDGTSTVIPANTDVTSYKNHVYAKAGAYMITLYSGHGFMPVFKVNYYIHANLLSRVRNSFYTMKEGGNTVDSFSYCFNGCGSLASIPSDLFINNPDATKFSQCFGLCYSLEAIPADLFRYNVRATHFSNTFRGLKITQIPVDLFRYNVETIYFTQCFIDCNGLVDIPAGLFRYNINVKFFKECFSGCSSAVLNASIFCDESAEMGTRFAGKDVDFAGCFNRNPNSKAAGGTA
ncbi:hypothetical protein LJC67_06720, partial [Bacteroidales bacterium OttesenSCG-928-A14]|nr:hypothetical protein [Bacteroidales bacterium OttesenSCG-928-A14]